jgi:SP family sugar:H+ symporter-like MFS transporter
MVGLDHGNLGPRVFFIWGSLCACCFVYAYFLVFETKGLTLEQVDKMMEECTPLTSSKWKPHTTFAAEMGLTEKGTIVPSALHEEAVQVQEEPKEVAA